MSAQTTAAWDLRGLTKRFPGVLANDAVDLTIRAGEIHGLMGENGSGKSTVIKLLTGIYQPDQGNILRHGEVVRISSPIRARDLGVAAVFQEFSLVPTLTVAENIHLGNLPVRGILVDWASMHARAEAALAKLSVSIDPGALVADLSVAGQQLVEIAKAIAADASLLILDEPTAALGPVEIAELHRVVRDLKGQGVAILYVSHRLDEVADLVDCVTILKDGKVIAPAGTVDVSALAIARAMIGEVAEHYPKTRNVTSEVLLELRDVFAGSRVRGASLRLHRGEVLGFGGVLGSGRTEIARAIFGADPVHTGEVLVSGVAKRFTSPSDAVASRIAYVAENRKADGLFFNFAGLPNISIARLERLTRGGFLDLAKEVRLGRELIVSLEVTPAAETRAVGLLSGGNQQKVAVARWLFAEAEIFILDEPTQGIDVGAKIAIYNLINALTASGKGVILISSDYEELLAMSDTVSVVSGGRIVSTVPSAELTKADLLSGSAVGKAAA
jgi:ABC-type sugar transport system ATPase subunit